MRKAEGGSDHLSNLVPRLRSEHKAKTLRDIIEIAKNKRIKRKHGQHLALVLLRSGQMTEADYRARAEKGDWPHWPRKRR